MAETWVKLGMQFGVPAINLATELRSKNGLTVMDKCQHWWKNSRGQADEPPPPDLIRDLQAFLEDKRPELKGLCLEGISYDAIRGLLIFNVTHESLPRCHTEFGIAPRCEYLERCAHCLKGLEVGKAVYMAPSGQGYVHLCSNECLQIVTKDSV